MKSQTPRGKRSRCRDGQVHPTFNLKENIMFNLDHSEAQSSTATVCDYAALYGATPERR